MRSGENFTRRGGEGGSRRGRRSGARTALGAVNGWVAGADRPRCADRAVAPDPRTRRRRIRHREASFRDPIARHRPTGARHVVASGLRGSDVAPDRRGKYHDGHDPRSGDRAVSRLSPWEDRHPGDRGGGRHVGVSRTRPLAGRCRSAGSVSAQLDHDHHDPPDADVHQADTREHDQRRATRVRLCCQGKRRAGRAHRDFERFSRMSYPRLRHTPSPPPLESLFSKGP